MEMAHQSLDRIKVQPKRPDLGLGPVNNSVQVAGLVINNDVAITKVFVQQYHRERHDERNRFQTVLDDGTEAVW